MASQVERIIRSLNLRPHPEGGYYRETYRSAGQVHHSALPDHYPAARNFSTAIYFLLPQGAVSKLHRIKSDEIFHFYAGGPATVVQIKPDGSVVKTVLGSDVLSGQAPQLLIPHGDWFGVYLNAETQWALWGCTVAPGFDFGDFEIGERESLLRQFPLAKIEIIALT